MLLFIEEFRIVPLVYQFENPQQGVAVKNGNSKDLFSANVGQFIILV